ncbi:dienelactone hydrolase family protein [Methylotenera sp.]|jgi:carboxymethylenebutenolidase|uniref:dienelactone hydrolase family protein n=1 Tax=Methylotenera sp. TaxID=2051956 RepID=UPI002726D18C|nr:dienelactone hydrolase family protein [Methylotenera sp.]MDO9204194.1 dienelactone hydrolase family protein [Methylotenera sp.]MDO9394879.1 dienelactone hydrolase family protein [Methylotenera sp.]MDP1523570.1 dienelactone hydrolase family protein [Methylotenera sp.]MDP1659119.1 dienelactone hydrolase family protein [Methylotenera sp.]MDP2070510.1 dienelactone hydrolase family protein [Methylotenera sp.]
MKIQSQSADILTPTGVMRTYIHRPVDGKPNGGNKYPAILFYSEIFQQTGPIESAAKIMASHGYVVLVPEVFHELNPIGTVLGYDDAGRNKGNADKETKDVQAYDTDNVAIIEFIKQQTWYDGNIGAMGFCIGGHLAFRAALQPEVKGTACFYATDLNTQLIPNKPGQHSMDRLNEITGEMLMIWGKQDPYIPTAGRVDIYAKMTNANLNFTWHEFNTQHAFMRDGDDRYDAQTALLCYQLALNLFSRTL